MVYHCRKANTLLYQCIALTAIEPDEYIPRSIPQLLANEDPQSFYRPDHHKVRTDYLGRILAHSVR